MKVNIIHQNTSKSNIDIEVFRLLFLKVKANIELVNVDLVNYECPNASINIFIYNINYAFVNNAKINILLLDHENLADFNIEYLCVMDYIFCKTEYSRLLIETAMCQNNISRNNLHLTGWKSPNIDTNHTKNFNEVLLYCNNRNNLYATIIEQWKENYPKLNVVYFNNKNRKTQNNIIYHDNKITNDQFHKLFNICGLHLIIEDKHSFSHLINQAKQVKSVPIATIGGSNKDIMNNDIGFVLSCKKRKSIDSYYGSRFTTNVDSIHSKINEIMKLNEDTLINLGINAHNNYTQYTGVSENKLLTLLNEAVNRVRNIKKPTLLELSDEKLPTVSIITPTYNRYKMFSLAIYNFNNSTYPKDKLEWIIIDDTEKGKDNIETLLPNKSIREEKYNIKYINLEERHTIGEKRNIGIRNSVNDIIVFMDDDDYYYPNYIKNRVNTLATYNKKCLGCTIIPSFEINKILSSINVPPLTNYFKERISPATLVFYKDFYNEEDGYMFSDSNNNECDSFITNRLNNIIETSWTKNIVSLHHKSNISKRSYPGDQESNGCHFGFSEKLFKFITSLDK